jgi:hypothetical protein
VADQENVPENALFVCFGAMSSSGTLTGIAVLEAMKRLDPKKTGIFCSSALAVDVPKHIDKDTTEPLFWTMRTGHTMSFAGASLAEASDRCPFIEKGATAIAWDGSLSPCLPLLHNHTSFMNDRERASESYVIGTVVERNLSDLWNDQQYITFRDRVQMFDFSPCLFCGGCELSEKNEEDCFGNTFPTCGGCLWAQGVIQCP